MAEKQEVEILAIDALDVEFPEVIPLKRKVVKKLLEDHKRGLRLLETWARVHLRALTAHPRTPTRFPDNFIDEIGGEAIGETRDKVFYEFSRAHVTGIEKPIGFEMGAEDLADANVDEMRLVEPSRKRKATLFKRLLKWKPKKKTEEEVEQQEKQEDKELEEHRKLEYKELKVRFAQFLEEEVYRHRSVRDSIRGTTSEDTLCDAGRWIAGMNHQLNVCHMAFKILGIVREKCEDVFKILSFNDLGPDESFKGEHSKLMQSRIAYLQTTKTVVFCMVEDTEKAQMDNEIYQECIDRFEQVLRSERKLLSRLDSAERTVIECMKEGESIITVTSPSHKLRAENLLKSESQRNLLLAAEEPDYILSEKPTFGRKLDTSGSSTDLSVPKTVTAIPITNAGLVLVVEVGGSSPGQNTNQGLYVEPKPAANSTSGYSTASLLTQSPADPLQDSSPRGEGHLFLDLPDPSAHGSSQKRTSKESSTSPMQTSPAETIPADEDSTDKLKDSDKKLEASKGEGSTDPMQTSSPEKVPSDEDSTDKLKDKDK